MTDTVRVARALRADSPSHRRPTRIARRAVMGRFAALRDGALLLREAGSGTTRRLGRPAGRADAVSVHVLDPRFWTAVALRGTVGAGEAWALGWWHSDDLAGVVRLLLRNRHSLERIDSGLARLSRPFLATLHALRRNTARGARRNIQTHYDVGDDFFRLFLDDTMTYSAGVFEHAEASMEEASRAKIDRICRKLDLRADDHLLEIGSGWGALAIHAAGRYRCRVTTTTISDRQFEETSRRVREAGLEDRVTVLKRDYRALEGRFDKIVSVEMIEAVGHAYYGAFFAQCERLLEPDGVLLMQAITIADSAYDRARRTVDFIKRYIFPGCCIPSVTALNAAMSKASELRLTHLEDITPHYARTLELWRQRLDENRGAAHVLGFDDTFLRLWEFYFAYCEGGFAERYLGDVQMLFSMPGDRSAPLLPRALDRSPLR